MQEGVEEEAGDGGGVGEWVGVLPWWAEVEEAGHPEFPVWREAEEAALRWGLWTEEGEAGLRVLL